MSYPTPPPYEPYEPMSQPTLTQPMGNPPPVDQPSWGDYTLPNMTAIPALTSPTNRPPGARWRTGWTIAIALIVCAVAATIGAVTASGGARLGGATAAQTAPTLPANLPTNQPAGTLSPDAIIGGTLAAFESSFGRPNAVNAQGSYYWSNVSLAGRKVTILLTQTTGLDGASHVSQLTISPVGGAAAAWDTATAFAVAQQFAPTDAQYVRNQSANASFINHVYSSSQLGAIFATGSRGGDDGGGGAATGLYAVSCHLTQAGGQLVDWCTLALTRQRGDN